MKKNILKRCLLLTPIFVLFITLFFLNYTVQYFKDTAFTFVYNTNTESVQRFSRELKELSSHGYTSNVYNELYINMIQSYNKTLGEKEAIITFLIDEDGQIYHSSDHNKNYLSELLQNEANMKLIDSAFETRSNGEVTLERGRTHETLYYHQFYSRTNEFSLFMCIEKRSIEAELQVYGIVIPISVIGLLLLLTMEYIIWLKVICISHPDEDI